MSTFGIAIDPLWRLPLLIVGASQSRSRATLTEDAIDIRFGFAQVRVPYTAIAGLAEREWSWLLGVGIRVASDRTLGLIGSTQGVVQITLKAPTVKGVLFMRHPRNIAVSLSEPAAFIEAVSARLPR